MANITQQIIDTREAAAAGRNPLIAQLASKRVYDEAVKSLDTQDKRPKVNFSRVLSTEQMRVVTENYPEFSVSYTGSALSVHSLAGGLRYLEGEYLMMQVPYGSPCYDIGGNYSQHMLKGRSYVHCCNPCLDLKDIARNEMYKDAIERYVTKKKDGPRSAAWRTQAESSQETKFAGLPSWQMDAFRRYHSDPTAVTCSDVFQQCEHEFHKSGDRYAVALHSIYDIPCEQIGPALLRKNIKVLFAAFHFSEELLIGSEFGRLPNVGAFFSVDDDTVNFQFEDESTLHYTHSFSNIRKVVTRTFFPASDRVVYVKEFMVKRVDTFFFRMVRVDTHMLHKSVGQYPVSKNDYYALKSSPIFQDKATFSVWFPNAKSKVVIPLFEMQGFFSGSLKAKKMLVDATFIHTVINHICTYDNKALTWRNVQSFVESIRSRVVVNGVSVRSEWDVPIETLCDISFTVFLLVKVKKAQVEIMSEKIVTQPQGLLERLVQKVSEAFEGCTAAIHAALASTGWFRCLADELVVETPELFMDFHDFLSAAFEADAKIEAANVESVLDASDRLYTTVTELCERYSGIEFDIEKFTDFCHHHDVNPGLIGTVIEAIFSQTAGITVTGLQAKSLEWAAAEALAPSDDCMDCDSDEEDVCNPKFPGLSAEEQRYLTQVRVKEDSFIELQDTFQRKAVTETVTVGVGALPTLPKQWVAKGKAHLPQVGYSVGKNKHSTSFDDEEAVALRKIHMMETCNLRLKKTITPVIYTGPIRVRQMANYLDYLSASLTATIGNLERIVRSSWSGENELVQTYGLFDCQADKWILQPTERTHSWGVCLTTDDKLRIVLLQYDEFDWPIVDKSSWKAFCVSADTKVFSVIRSLEVLSRLPLKDCTAKFTLIDGVPGCGKTQEIISSADFKTDLILTPGKEAASMIRRRANMKYRGCVATNDNVRTFDSFVMNLKPYKFKTLWVDEGLMVHTGLLNFCVNISNVTEVKIFGDTKQIPFINRVMNFDYPLELKKIIVDNVEKRYTSKRCPRDVTHYLNEVYAAPVSTTSAVIHSVSQKKIAGVGLLRPELTRLEGKIITFTQSDKQTLLKAGYQDVNTVHEVQGETYEDTSVVRATATPIGLISRKSPHVLVALSRHTKTMTYYTVTVDPVSCIIADLEKVDQSILSMYASVAGTK
ncbi:131 kDa replicase [Trichosanthes mottle mosaic virus]|nr:131 kDa replicase [Trichosanthes mottle mosaic virus]